MSTQLKYRFTNKETVIELLDFSMEEFTQLCIKGRDIPRQTILKAQISELQQELQSRDLSNKSQMRDNSRKSA